MSDCIAEMCRENTRLRAENERLRADLAAVTAERDRMQHRIARQRAYYDRLAEKHANLWLENERLREALRPFAKRINLLDECKNAAKYAVSTDINVEHLRRARDAYNNTK